MNTTLAFHQAERTHAEDRTDTYTSNDNESFNSFRRYVYCPQSEVGKENQYYLWPPTWHILLPSTLGAPKITRGNEIVDSVTAHITRG